MWWMKSRVWLLLSLLVLIFVAAPQPTLATDVEETGPEICEVSLILVSGNVRTREKLIISELPFVAGALIPIASIPALAERAKENLLNTSLFNIVNVSYRFPATEEVVFEIQVVERWYMWVFPIFEQAGRNFADFLRLNDGSLFNYGVYFKQNNLTGRNETLRIRMVTGYKDHMVIDYQNPGLNNQSGWGITTGLMVFDQMPYSTLNDKQVFLKLLGDKVLQQTHIQFSYFYRHNLDHRHRFSLGYLEDRASDTLLAINPNYLPFGENINRYIELGYQYQYDTRDSKYYPLDGSYYEITARRKGLGLVSDFQGFFQGKVIAAWHKPLLKRFSGSSTVTLSGIDRSEVPYVFRTGLGYEEFLNGFEYKVVDGSSFGAIQNKLLFELVPRKDKTLKFIRLKQFSQFHYAIYLRMHLDAGYVANRHKTAGNVIANSLMLGYGAGLDLVTFYDTVLSLNYSLNNFGGRGFFVHFNLSM
jgi:outer membrane protein assembly factor BamA